VTNVDVVDGDGARGWGSEAYDVIVVSGSLPLLPDAFLKQLKIGGRLLVTIGDEPVMSAQIVTRVSDAVFETVKLFETSIKPLQNAAAPSQFKF